MINKKAFDDYGNVITPTPHFTFTIDGIITVTTDSSGFAQVNNLSLGQHSVSENVPAGWTLTSMNPASGVVNVVAGTQCAKITFKDKKIENKPACVITAHPDHIVIHEDPLLEWTSTNATSATLDPGIGSVPVNGSTNVFPEETTTYILTVTGPGGTAQCEVTVTVEIIPPEEDTAWCDISASDEIVAAGDSIILSWDSEGHDPWIDEIGDVPNEGSDTFEIFETTTFTMHVYTNFGNEENCNVTVVVDTGDDEPSCDIWADPSHVEAGEAVSLGWTSENAVEATLTYFGDVAVTGDVDVFPENTVMYTLTVWNSEGESAECHVTIVVDEEPPQEEEPSCDIWASDTHILDGETTTLSWNSDNASSASLSSIGSVSTDGTREVAPHATKTYTLTVWNDGGESAQCRVTIVVEEDIDEEEPSCWIDANPGSIEEGDGTTLTWDSDNASSASIASIGSVSLSGSRFISNLFSTKTYTLTVWNDEGESAECHTTVTVTDTPVEEPSCWINSNPSSIDEGDAATLTWNSSNATSAHLSSVGSVGTSGTNTVYPGATKTYTLTVYSDDGESAQCETTVHVENEDESDDFDRPSCDINHAQEDNWWNSGDAVYLSWNSDNADRATLSGYGNVPTDGSKTVRPNRTTTYTLTVWNDHGTEQCRATVHVDDDYDDDDYDRPSCTIQLSDYDFGGHGKARLSWWSSDANHTSISSIGSVNTSDSMTVYPDGNRVYTMTVSGPGGTATCHTSHITPYLPPVIGQPYVTLTQIPYTGFDFGPMGNAMYWLGMVLLALGGAYLIVQYRGGAFAYAGGYRLRSSSLDWKGVLRTQYQAFHNVAEIAAYPINSLLRRSRT